MLIWSLFDDYLIDYLIDYFIDYLASNNQQIIQIIHVLFWWIFWLFDEYLIDYLIEYLICLICEYLIWLIWDYLMIIWLFRLNCFAYVMLIWWLLVPNYLWLFDDYLFSIILNFFDDYSISTPAAGRSASFICECLRTASWHILVMATFPLRCLRRRRGPGPLRRSCVGYHWYSYSVAAASLNPPWPLWRRSCLQETRHRCCNGSYVVFTVPSTAFSRFLPV